MTLEANCNLTAEQLLWLLQLSSPGLPVGAYAYSEGVEALVAAGTIADRETLQGWLADQLRYGAIRTEVAIALRARRYWHSEREAVLAWNAWLSASWETSELRAQSWQMGRSLGRLLGELVPGVGQEFGGDWNWAVVWGVAMALQGIPENAAALAYIQAWATNLIGAGVKLIPLGQTAGQAIWLQMQGEMLAATKAVLAWEDADLESCNWGLALASLAHETQEVRLFRS